MTEPETRPDPLRREVRLDRGTTIPVLGIPVSFESNDEAVIHAAEEAFGAWHIVEHVPQLLSEERVRVRVFVEQGSERKAKHASIVYRMPDEDRILVRTPGSTAIADVARRDAVAYVTRSLVDDRAHFRYGVLEAITLAILTQLDRQPIHAAALTRDQCGLLLAGPSGTGKSTLTYAAARHGLKVLAEDMVYVQMRPRLRIWGLPGHLHLPVTARHHFPELAESLPTLLANGKQKIAINLRTMGALPEMPVAPRAGICVLTRSGGTPSLETVSGDVLTARMTERIEPGFDIFAETVEPAIRILARYGGWHLDLGRDPAAAIPLLEAMLEDIAEA
ncbi:MAG: hypothetical protein ACREL7_03810 [Longimicrobiales bacterium]